MLCKAIIALGIFSLARLLMPFRRMAAMRASPHGPYPDHDRQIELVAEARWAVMAASRRVPWRTMCLEQGFAAHWLLAFSRVPSTLHYGVAKQQGEELTAHLWVRAGTIDVIGCEDVERYRELKGF